MAPTNDIYDTRFTLILQHLPVIAHHVPYAQLVSLTDHLTIRLYLVAPALRPSPVYKTICSSFRSTSD